MFDQPVEGLVGFSSGDGGFRVLRMHPRGRRSKPGADSYPACCALPPLPPFPPAPPAAVMLLRVQGVGFRVYNVECGL
jgi:hypothetical protein